jgi:hypothetical protein
MMSRLGARLRAACRQGATMSLLAKASTSLFNLSGADLIVSSAAHSGGGAGCLDSNELGGVGSVQLPPARHCTSAKASSVAGFGCEQAGVDAMVTL